MSDKIESKIDKDIEDYSAKDFLDIFKHLYYTYYEDKFIPDIPLDIIKIKKAQDVFIEHDLNNREFKDFLRWAITDKAREKDTKMSIGLLKHVAKDYIEKEDYENVYEQNAEEEEEQLSEDMKEWIESKREEIEEERGDI